MRTAITKIVSFDAAHRLPDHAGRCRNLHGHTYRLEATVAGAPQETGPGTGMVLDFAELEQTLQRVVVNRLDHTYLNDVLDVVPTAEGIAAWAFAELKASGLEVRKVRLWESPTSFAEVED
ncbi:MAG: 6-carboxytetrahydropterin synthase QueD [Gaiellales bacterium]|nr:6-carboxytetrahydropterin synthase QueD [Gaiellales bacterium]